MPGFSEPIRRTFRQATGSDDPAEYFGADVRTFSLATRFGGSDPAALHGRLPAGTVFDEWGIGHQTSSVEGTLDRHYPPLVRAESVEEVEALPSPVIDPHADTARVAAYHQAGYPVFGYAGSIYEWSWWIRGMEQFLTDVLGQPDLAEAVVRKVEAHTTRLALATARAGIDVLSFYDDAGTQRGMQIAPELWRRLVKPAWQRVLDAVRREVPQARFFLHSCGRIDPIIADIAELGFHVLHPLQPECVDFEAAHRRYGRSLVLAATVSSQRLFPFGTPQQVRQEVRRLAAIVGPGHRAILMPSNVIQPETPWENVLAFAEEAKAVRGG
jgi:uroporphyrinogen decarboxylase